MQQRRQRSIAGIAASQHGSTEYRLRETKLHDTCASIFRFSTSSASFNFCPKHHAQEYEHKETSHVLLAGKPGRRRRRRRRTCGGLVVVGRRSGGEAVR